MAATWVTNRGRLAGPSRLDPAYYHPRFQGVMRAIARFPRTSTLGQIAPGFAKGIFDIHADEYQEHGVPFVRIGNLRGGFLSEAGLAFISPERHQEAAKTALEMWDIALSKTAYPAAALVTLEECNVSQDIIAVRTGRNRAFNTYLVSFLNSVYGRLQMERLFQGNTQTHLALADAKTVVVPIPEESFLDSHASVVMAALDKLRDAHSLAEEAQGHLYSLLHFRPPQSAKVHFEVQLGAVRAAGRADSEFFRPKYQRFLHELRRGGATRIGEVAALAKEPFAATAVSEFHYIEIANVDSRLGLATAEVVQGEDAPGRARWVVRPGDVITSLVRPLRRLSALITPDQDGYVCSSGFAALRPAAVEPEFLLAFLRLPLVCELMNLHASASMYPAISSADVLRLPIIVPPANDRARIVEKIRGSIEALAASQELTARTRADVEAFVLAGE